MRSFTDFDAHHKGLLAVSSSLWLGAGRTMQGDVIWVAVPNQSWANYGELKRGHP